LDLFQQYNYLPTSVLIYNNIFKIYYLISNYFTLYLIYSLYRKTLDKLHETLPIFGYLIGAHILTWSTCYLTEHKEIDREFFWTFSIYLEMFAIIPQLTLIYKQGMISKTMTYYLLMLGSYRAFYILNWIYRYKMESFWEPISFFCGCIQTIIYLHFFIHIYPSLSNKNEYQSVEDTQNFIKIIDTKENINQETKHDIPLIHTFV
jgi:ER lumen protein retaining receptor